MPKTSAKELQRRKEAARRHDAEKKRIDAKIAEMEKHGSSEQQIRDALGPLVPTRLDALDPLFPPNMDAATEFIVNRMLPSTTKSKTSKKVKRGSSRLNRAWNSIYDALDSALIELSQSDIPLDDQWRHSIAAAFHRRAFRNPESVVKSKRRVEAKLVASLKRLLKERGETALDAEGRVAEAFGLRDVDSLRKRIRRTRKIIQRTNK
jgi:hypothetical protein